jgi:hypothetical protein
VKVHHNFFSQDLPDRQIQGERQGRAIMEVDPIVCRDVLQELRELPDPPSESKRTGKVYAVRLVPSSPLLDGKRLWYAANVAHMDYFHYYYQKIIEGMSIPSEYLAIYSIRKGGHSETFPFFGLASSKIS